jgi:Branched-chain amino acid transport protein (AzlD)
VTVWLTVGALSLGTAAIKAAGPIALGRREPSERVAGVIALVAPALLSALVVYETVHTGDRGFAVDARVAGLAAAGVALAVRLPLVVVIAVAAAVAAAVRLVS